MSAYLGQIRGVIAWIVPGTTLVLMPKCPACVAAYVALGTGIGLSMTMASYLRMAILFVCVGWISWMVLRRMWRRCCCESNARARDPAQREVIPWYGRRDCN